MAFWWKAIIFFWFCVLKVRSGMLLKEFDKANQPEMVAMTQ